MEKILSAYREFYWLYETFLRNVESTFKHGFQTNERIQKLCQDYRERKGYNITHRAKIELSELKYQKNIDFDLILSDVRKEVGTLHLKIREIIDLNQLNHVDIMPTFECFFWTVNWFWKFEKWFYATFPQNKNTDQVQTSFQTTIAPEKLPVLRQRLIDGYYIAPETNLQSFEAVFNGLPLPYNFEPVKWIKHPKRNKNTTAKKALTDLLILIGTPKIQYRDFAKLKTCFADSTGNPLTFTQSNFDNSKDFKDTSEYFPELQNIIKSL